MTRTGTGRRAAWSLTALVYLLALSAAGPASAEAAPLRAGAASFDITPPNGGTTLGYVRPDVAVEGVHTRLTGRALVLDDGDTEVALLATDLAFALDKDSVVARVADLGFSHETVLYTGTHTHSGPGDLEDWQIDQLAGAIREAHAAKAPARAAWGTREVPGVGRNRSIEAHLANHGTEQAYGQGRPEDDPLGVEHTLDATLRLLRVERRDGTPLAAWLNFPVHLTMSTPAVDVWDADVAAPAQKHLEGAIRERGFLALYTNGSSGDLMPVFDSYNATSLMDLNGRRIARQARRAWRAAGRRIDDDVPVDVRWTRSCYCGQEVEPGRRVSSEPVWGVPFLGGSEDGASIFHEPLATEGRRLPAELADPVHGRKIQAAPTRPVAVHETNPEFHAIRIGDRLLLGAPGEPSVEMGRRFVRAVEPVLPAGISESFAVGLSNDYMGYFTTPEEYDMQHYEGGHTVYGLWTSLLAQSTFVELSRAMAGGQPAPTPSQPPALGDGGGGEPGVGYGGVDGRLVEGPAGKVPRMTSFRVSWSGAPNGVDRPLDEPFLVLERKRKRGWRPRDTDLGLSFLWREADGTYGAIYDVGPSLPAGRYRVRVQSGSYELATDPFRVVRSSGLVVRGVEARTRGADTRLVVRAQNPPPDPTQSLVWRSQTPVGGRAVVKFDGERRLARWNPGRRGWVTRVPGRVAEGELVKVVRLRDRFGNRARPGSFEVGDLAVLDWPPNMGVGGGRTPGPFGEGQFPP
jgi:neutral ceramidase